MPNLKKDVASQPSPPPQPSQALPPQIYGHTTASPPLISTAFDSGPLNAIWFPRAPLSIYTYPNTNNTDGTDGGLTENCTRCGPKGCYCSSIEVDNPNNFLGWCQSCIDTMNGTMCYCSEEQFSSAPRCTIQALSDYQPCRLNVRLSDILGFHLLLFVGPRDMYIW